MTDAEDLREWSATRVMGWHELSYSDCWISEASKREYLKKDWKPDLPETGQIWQFVERMRELGWVFMCDNEGPWDAIFWHVSDRTNKFFHGHDANPCLAILKAAKAALEGK